MKTMTKSELAMAEERGELIRPSRRDRDVSGPNAYGYAYERDGQQSETIWVSDGNPTIGRPGSGAFVVRFSRALPASVEPSSSGSGAGGAGPSAVRA